MGEAKVSVDAMAGAGSLADQGALASGDGDAHAGDVGDAPAAFAIATDGAFVFGDAAADHGGALPAIKTKDAVGLADHLPPLEVADAAAPLLPLAHVGALQRSREGCNLPIGEAGGGSGFV